VTAPRAAGVYRALLRFYPRSFRDEYGPDMVLLFANQLRDEPALRVWTRGFVDLAVTVPGRHLEAHMNRPPNSTVPLLFAAVGFAGVIFGIVGGSNRGMLAVGLSVAVVAGVLAVVAWRHTRVITAAPPVTAQWWKFLVGGAGAIVAMIVAEGATDLSLWWPMVITILAALVALAIGLVLGVAHLVGGIRSRGATS
jgi:hypothetical protein